MSSSKRNDYSEKNVTSYLMGDSKPGEPYKSNAPNNNAEIKAYYLSQDPNNYKNNKAYFRADIDIIHYIIESAKQVPIIFDIISREDSTSKIRVSIDPLNPLAPITLVSGPTKIQFDENGNIVQSEILLESASGELTKYPGTQEAIDSNGTDKILVNKKTFCVHKPNEKTQLSEKYTFYSSSASPELTNSISKLLEQPNITQQKSISKQLEQPNSTQQDNPSAIIIQKNGINPEDSIEHICSIDESSPNSIQAESFTRTGTYNYYVDRANKELEKKFKTCSILIGAAISMYNSSEVQHDTIREQALERILEPIAYFVNPLSLPIEIEDPE